MEYQRKQRFRCCQYWRKDYWWWSSIHHVPQTNRNYLHTRWAAESRSIIYCYHWDQPLEFWSWNAPGVSCGFLEEGKVRETYFRTSTLLNARDWKQERPSLLHLEHGFSGSDYASHFNLWLSKHDPCWESLKAVAEYFTLPFADGKRCRLPFVHYVAF